jgi:hypothetical protein
MLKLTELKASLAECHLKSDDRKTKMFQDINDHQYFLNRTIECIGEIKDGVDVMENTKLGIQLMNYFRVLYRQQHPVDAVEDRHDGPVQS